MKDGGGALQAVWQISGRPFQEGQTTFVHLVAQESGASMATRRVEPGGLEGSVSFTATQVIAGKEYHFAWHTKDMNAWFNDQVLATSDAFLVSEMAQLFAAQNSVMQCMLEKQAKHSELELLRQENALLKTRLDKLEKKRPRGDDEEDEAPAKKRKLQQDFISDQV